MAKTDKIGHQLFLPEEMSKRLQRVAHASGRARSELLVEALDVWFARRDASSTAEALGVRLHRIERSLDWMRRNQGLAWEIMARLVRHQLVYSAQTPPSREAVALGAKQFAELVDEVVDRLEGKAEGLASDPSLKRLRSVQ